jgi:hypothetical protein
MVARPFTVSFFVRDKNIETTKKGANRKKNLTAVEKMRVISVPRI